MHCRQCGYALWNLSEPRCPECGTGFDLRTYRFTPGTVAFACPHCGHLHGGAGERYLPAETEQAQCLGCGQAMDVKAMHVMPLVDDARAVDAAGLPWEDRRRLGFWKAWWRTVVMGIASPMRIGELLTPDTRLGPAYWFACVTMGAGLLVHGALLACLFGVVALAQGEPALLVVSVVVLGLAIAAALLMPVFSLALTVAPAHLFLMLTGPKRGGYRLTAVSTLYASGPMIFFAIPICGYYLNGIWQLWMTVVAILVTIRTQQVSGWRGALAFLWLLIVGMIVGFLFVVVLIASGVMNP
ncbi:MAG: hypothetical protein WD042_05595 [Phycisphaeraceae bacterium]